MYIIIPSGSSIPSSGNDCVNITTTDDNLIEGDHEFDIVIISSSEGIIASSSVNTVTIIDDDGMYTWFSYVKCAL